MEDTNIYRRPAFPNRPWITGRLYDTYANMNILHCDAYLLEANDREYLVIDWRTGGRKREALDAWLIEPDGLTPVWDGERLWNIGKRKYWTKGNDAMMGRIHGRVVMLCGDMLNMGRWTRVSLQAHYVNVRETDCELGDKNKYKERPKGDEPREPTHEDVLAKPSVVGKRRGRPRKGLPDWL